MNRSIRVISMAALLLPGFAFAQDDKSPSPGTPNLAVARVKVENGVRVSKIIGAAVYNGNSQQVGSIDDVILDKDQKASLAVISVGGFLGVGGKMVAVPYDKIERTDDGKVLMQDGTKESLAKQPSFSYAQ